MLDPISHDRFLLMEPTQDQIDELTKIVNDSILCREFRAGLPSHLRAARLIAAVAKRFDEAGWWVYGGNFRLDMMYPDQWEIRVRKKHQPGTFRHWLHCLFGW